MMSRIVSDVSYDANGRYPLSVKNALGHTENYTYEAGTGARKTLQDINGLGSSWVTDGFGRVVKEVHPDGNEIRSYVKQWPSYGLPGMLRMPTTRPSLCVVAMETFTPNS